MDWIGKLLQIWSLKISKLSATQLAWKVEVKQIVELIDKHVLAEISTSFESFVYDRYFSGIKILSLPLRKRMNDILVYNILVIFDFLWINDFRKEQNRVAKSIQFFVQTFSFLEKNSLFKLMTSSIVFTCGISHIFSKPTISFANCSTRIRWKLRMQFLQEL